MDKECRAFIAGIALALLFTTITGLSDPYLDSLNNAGNQLEKHSDTGQFPLFTTITVQVGDGEPTEMTLPTPVFWLVTAVATGLGLFFLWKLGRTYLTDDGDEL